MVDVESICKLNASDFKKVLEKMTDSEITEFIHNLNPSQRRTFLDNLTNSEIISFRNRLPQAEKTRFMDLLLNDGKKLFWENERKLVEQGKGTRNWTSKQQEQILAGKVPTSAEGTPFEAHHMYSKEQYPKFAADMNNFQALSKKVEHIKGAHNGNTRLNQTHGYYDESDINIDKLSKSLYNI